MLKQLSAAFLIIFMLLHFPACTKDDDAGKIGELAEIKESDPFEGPFSGNTDMFRPETTEAVKINYAYSGNEIPEFFPKELPVYTRSKVTSCRILENNKGAIAVLLTQDAPGKVAEFYLNFAKEKNWKTRDKIMTENIFSLMAKKDSSTISISAAKGTNGTALTLAISLNEK